MPSEGHAAAAYGAQGHDRVREAFETTFYAGLLPRLIKAAGGGGAVLDLGCGNGLAKRLAGTALGRYVGVDLREPPGGLPGEIVKHDLRDGLGAVGGEPFDLYLATFGVASHLRPAELRELLGGIARHGRRGSIVALEALGLFSLEWPRIWETEPGPARALPYRLRSDVAVHPWSPPELAAMYEEAGIKPLHALDRTIQTGPKAGEGRYWPGLPPLRRAMNALLEGTAGAAETSALIRLLPPLPAGDAATLHHGLAARRRRLVETHEGRFDEGRFDGGRFDEGRFDEGRCEALARAVWALEPRSGGGFGHGLMLLGRVA